MTKKKMIILDVPKAVAKDVNKRAVDALRINIEYAATLDGQYRRRQCPRLAYDDDGA